MPNPAAPAISWIKENMALWLAMNVAVLGAFILFLQLIDGYQQKQFEQTFEKNPSEPQ